MNKIIIKKKNKHFKELMIMKMNFYKRKKTKEENEGRK